jgi:hypothetical protein
MHSSFFSRARFDLQRCVRARPIATLCLGTAAVLLMLSAFLRWEQIQRGHAVRARLDALRLQSGIEPLLTRKSDDAPELPTFRSSELVDALEHAGRGSGLVMTDISYSLDASPTRPYLRYQVSLSMVGTYPLVRRFIDDVALEMPHLILDSISCSRDGIAATRPVCDLSFSTFYRKDLHG